MSVDMVLDQPHSLDRWAVWFKEELALPDLDEPGVLAFMHYFADLEILESVDENRWKLCGVDFNQSPDQIRDVVRDQLETLSRTDEGFAAAYFLGRRPDPSSISTKGSQPKQVGKFSSETKNPEREIASDLSNLQIVKKVGRQLKPFLDFEKETLSRLQGKYTQAKDARLIFNFILRQTQQKAEPKKWEQLSRKRHK